MIWLLILCFSTSCATARGRFLFGAAGGAAVGAGSATLLSPNPESRGLNALVFGLVGALAGGVISLLFKDPEPATAIDTSLKARELGKDPAQSTLYAIPPNSKLPVFVKERLQPVVVEEAEEPDTVSDDGTLHAPHKIYRIQRPAELYAKPVVPHANPAENNAKRAQ